MVAESGGPALPVGRRATLIEEESEDVSDAAQKPLQQPASILSTRVEHKQKSSSANMEEVNFRADTEANIHQRSRSNEMDYFSSRASTAKQNSSMSSAFRSPPCLIQQATPPSGSGGNGLCKEDSMVSPLHSPKSLQQPNTTCCSPAPSDATPHSPQGESCTDERECHSEPRDSREVTKRERTGTSQSERYSWLKDFDSPLWSNYFTSQEDAHYSDC